MSTERLKITQLIEKVQGLDRTARHKLIDEAIEKGIINEVSAGMLISALNILEGKKIPRTGPDSEKD